jgi:hypothetical protein
VHKQAPTRSVFDDLTEYEVGQVWAEALTIYKAGEALYLDGEMSATAKQIQKEHTEEHPWTGIISQYLEIKLPEDWHKMTRYERASFLQSDELTVEGTKYRERVCVLELWIEALNMRTTIDERSANTLRDIMRNIDGWEEENKVARYGIYGTQRRGFVRVDQPLEIQKSVEDLRVTKMLQQS